MRVQFLQDWFDSLRGKKVLSGTPIRQRIVDANHSEIDSLFEKFDHGIIEIYGRKCKYLRNVNADVGVTEQTLTLLCQQFPQERSAIKVLNIGCGRKDQVAFVRELCFDSYGVDFDIEQDTDRTKFHDLNTQDELPFAPDYFDAVICQEIIEHIENPWLLMRKIKRILKIGGTLIVTTPNICTNKSKRAFARNNFGHFTYFDPSNLWQHINPIPYWEMMHISRYNGFKLLQLSGCNEYFVNHIPRKQNAPEELKQSVIIQNNDVLHYLFSNMDSEIKLYQPKPTYGHTWGDS